MTLSWLSGRGDPTQLRTLSHFAPLWPCRLVVSLRRIVKQIEGALRYTLESTYVKKNSLDMLTHIETTEGVRLAQLLDRRRL